MSNAEGGGDDFGAMLEQFEAETGGAQGRGPQVGDEVVGTVISIGEDAVFLDLGGKSEGMLDREQLADRDGALTVAVGDTVKARVSDSGERSGIVKLRVKLGRGPEAKKELLDAFEHKLPVEGVVMSTNKGGFEVQVAGVRAFCPVSQIDNRFVEDPELFVGQRFEFRITKYEVGGRGDLVLSRRALLEELAAEKASETRTRLEVGAVFEGTVTAVKDYGAFVDIGGLEGMLHVSELGHTRVNSPADVLAVGQTLRVQVVKIEKTDNPKRPEKIGLSLKSLETSPWESVREKFPLGSRPRGVVTRVKPFGAFVEIAPGIEGLVHISEMGGGKRIATPRDVVSEGEAVQVTVLSVDDKEQRISLSLDAAEREAGELEEREAMAAHKGSAPRSLGTFADLLKGKLGDS